MIVKNSVRTKQNSIRKRKRKNNIVIQNWHLECHEEGSRLYRLTMALAEEADFNDPDVIAYASSDGHLLSNDIGD